MTANIILIDDDEEIVEVTALILEEHGYSVRAGRSKQDLMTALSQQQPDLLIIDICLDSESGNLIAESLKADPQTSHIPILLFSALNLTRSLTKVADGVLRKPYDMDVLLELVAKHTQHKVHAASII